MVKVSVIMPNYNQSLYIERAIQSVLEQTYRDFEIIVIDDGSTDNSKDVVGIFGDKVHYIWQKNKGLGGARNMGIIASNAEFIGLLDADDEWKPVYLEKMMVLAENFPDAAVYFSGAQGMDSAGKDLPQFFGRMVAAGEIYQNLLRANFIIPSTVVFRRAAIVEAGLFEEKNRDLHGCEDWDLWLRLCPAHSFAWTADSLVRYRLHENTFSANPSHMQSAVRAVIEKNFGPEDGNCSVWTTEKRRAYGGVYRYRALTSVQKQGDWEVATEALGKALGVDPTLADDLDLFYELSFGAQPPGYRETLQNLDLEQNAELIMRVLVKVFAENPALESLRRRTFGTASYGIGLVAYNTGRRDLSRRFLSRAISFSPTLMSDQKIVFTLSKSFMHPSFVGRLKQLVKGNYYQTR